MVDLDAEKLRNVSKTPFGGAAEFAQAGAVLESGAPFDQEQAVSFGLETGTMEFDGRAYRVGVKGMSGELPDSVGDKTVEPMSDAEKARFHSQLKMPLGLQRLEAWKLPLEPETGTEVLGGQADRTPFAEAGQRPAVAGEAPVTNPAISEKGLASGAVVEAGRRGVSVRNLKEAVRRTISGKSGDSIDQIAQRAAAAHGQNRGEV